MQSDTVEPASVDDRAHENIGRPRSLEPDEKTIAQIRGLALIQCTKDEVAAVMGVHRATFYRFLNDYPEVKAAWEDSLEAGRVSLRRKQWKLADKSAGMAIFLGKQFLDQKDVSAHELTGPDGGPIQTEEVSARDILADRISDLATRKREVGDTGKPDGNAGD